jgi:hypothetical protein
MLKRDIASQASSPYQSSSLDKSEILTDVEDSKEIRERTDSEEEGGRHGGHGAPYSGEKHLGRDYYSKRFRLLVQYMVEGGPPTAMREEMETVILKGRRGMNLKMC